MVLNQAKELGRTIAGQQKQIDGLKQEISPNDPSASFPLFAQETFSVPQTVTFTKRVLSSTSFYIDHPVYGDIDSATLALDGDYDTGDPEDGTVIFSGTM
jgi:hypothetical protein